MTTLVTRQMMTTAHRAAIMMLALAPAWLSAAGPTDLESERQNLAAARSAYHAALAEYRTLLDQGALGSTEKDDYADYLSRLEESVAKSCERISAIKTAQNDLSAEVGCDLASAPSGPVSFPGESTADERVATLDQRLGRSMSEFDEELLREMDELKKQQSGSPDGSRGAGGADGEGGGSGSSEVTSSDGSAGQTDAQGGTPGDEPTDTEPTTAGESGSGGGEAEQGDGQVASRQQESGKQQQGSLGNSNNNTGGSSSKPDEPPAAADDDIVARQLREAAENETDPVLREKLWDEYRRYKADSADKTSKNNN